mmetsp:Transcript_14834/g.42527  ORF Transcript_14834/g.42527 Transcript_14834/m.42527 type:complete len:880 (-) Transcript_14834:72-2711(-)
MAQVLDERGEEAVVGKTSGYWLDADDFFSTAELDARNLGLIGFPRDWPNVYKNSKALKSLVGKKGKCAGKKVGIVEAPLPEENAQVKGLTFYPLQSFSNSERVAEETGLQVVRGWAIFEHKDEPMSSAFVAERFWWNTLPDGKWVDFTPRPEDWPVLLLAEAAGDAAKERSVLTAEAAELTVRLLRQHYHAAPPPAPKAAKEDKSRKDEPAKAKPKQQAAPASVAELIARLREGDAGALKELEEKIKGNEELCVQVACDGVALPLVQMLSDEAKHEDALKLLLLLTDAGVGQKIPEVGTEVINKGAVVHLIKIITNGSANLQELAAAVLGNLCHESPANQDKVAKAGVLRPLVALLSGEIGPAQEAAYAIWNLTVGHAENSAKVVRQGAVPKLTELLKSTSDIAQENAAGALMHVTMSEEARTAIVQADAIPRLCDMLAPSYEPEVSSQAAGALLNLASDGPDYSRKIVQQGAIGPLINLVRDGPDLAREYAAGALMNLIRGDMKVAERAFKEGAVQVLANLLQKPTGHSEALGALANLASGSSERQIAIYKAQVTRVSVRLLSDPDVDVRRSAAALIMNLAPHSKIKERIVEAGALKPLAKVLSDSDDAVKERAAGALANLFNDHSANVHAGYKQAPDMINSLINILKAPGLSEDAKRQAAHALAMLSAEDGPCDAVWNAVKPGEPLLKLLSGMVAEAALGIMNLSWRWPEVKHDLARSGTLGYLMTMLRTGDVMAKEYAAGALMNMTAGSAENAEKAVPVVPALVELLRADGIQAAEWGAGALANIVRAGPEAQREAAERNAAAHLAALLPKVTVNGKTLVVLALTSLAEGQAQAVMKALSGSKEKAKLRDFRDSGNEELTDYTTTLVEKIGNGFAL